MFDNMISEDGRARNIVTLTVGVSGPVVLNYLATVDIDPGTAIRGEIRELLYWQPLWW
jgi:hypothetical protein